MPDSNLEKPLPSGIITFMFSDIQGSTPLWEHDPEGMRAALAQHHAIIREAIESNGGQVFQIVGDEFCAAFVDPAAAVSAALAGQRGLKSAVWGSIGQLNVRMGLHMGPIEVRDGDYLSSHTMNRVARVMAAAHGGQILLTGEVGDMVRRTLSEGVGLLDLGQHRMKGMQFLEHINQLTAPDLALDFPAIGTLPLFSSNLPPQPTPFIGRISELAILEGFIIDQDASLVTIFGPGGMGKTRLSLAFGERLVAQFASKFPDGVYFIDLAPLDNAEHILPTLVESLNFSLMGEETDERPSRQKVLDYLREKRLLLLMDNFEHLLTGAEFVADILATAPGVKIVATSRERLHLRQEQVYPIGGLDFPDWDVPQDAMEHTAVKLFIQSARRSQPDFTLDNQESLTYLVRICRTVAGMPLAIELAAGWVDTLSLAEIAEELQAGLDLLETEMRDVPERHRSIRAAIDYSWHKLTAEEKQLFAQLSVFRGGLNRMAGTAIATANLRALSRLVNKSFLHYDQERERYQLHELMRQFGAEMLAEDSELETAVRQRHSTYYCQALGEITEDLKGHRQKEAIEVIEQDIENARAAWNWAVKHRAAELLDAALFGLFQFYEWRGRYQDAAETVETALSALDQPRPTPEQAQVMIRLLHRKYELIRAVPDREVILARTGALLAGMESTGAERAAILQAKDAYFWGWLSHDKNNFPQAREWLNKSLGYLQTSGDTWDEVRVLLELGSGAASQGNFLEAERLGQAARTLAHELGDRWSLIDAMDFLAYIANQQANNLEMRRLQQEILELARNLGNLPLYASALKNIGTSYSTQGKAEEALPYHLESLEILRRVGNPSSISWGLTMVGVDTMFLEQYNIAEQWLREGKAAAQQSENVRDLLYNVLMSALLALLQEQYGIALERAQEAHSLLDKPGNGDQGMKTIVWTVSCCVHFAQGAFVEAEILALRALAPGTIWGRSVLAVVGFLLALRKPDHEGVRQAWQLVGLFDASSLWAKYKLLKEIPAKLQPPEMLILPEKEIEEQKEIGRSLDPDAVVKELLETLHEIGWGQE